MKTLESQITQLEKMRSKWLMFNLTGFIIWDGYRIANTYLFDNTLNNTWNVIYISGWLIWIVGLIQLFRFGMKVKHTKLATQIFNDEFVLLTRLKSWKSALVIVVITQILIIGASIVSWEISGALSAEITLFVAVVTAMSTFIYQNTLESYA